MWFFVAATFLGRLVLLFLGPEDMQKLYEEWLQCEEKWSKSSYVIQLQQTSEFCRMGARRWMTYAQICDKYKSSDIATCIVEEKKSNPKLAGQMKPHPDCPSKKEPKLHWECHNSRQNISKYMLYCFSSFALCLSPCIAGW